MPSEWTKNGRDYERKCSHCHGTGIESLFRRGQCQACPWEKTSDVAHPANTPRNLHGGYDVGIAHKLVRCDVCGGVWMVYFETSDDSWDVPAPEYVGTAIPNDAWRIGQSAHEE